MAEDKLLNIREVSIILGITEKEVVDLAQSGQIPAYKVAGMYLRFKKEQVDEFRARSGSAFKQDSRLSSSSLREKIGDFFYFNDFYILAALIILLMLVVIFKNIR